MPNCRRFTFISTVLALVATCTFLSSVLPANAADKSRSVTRSAELVVVRLPNSNTFAAYSKHSGKWTKHSFAKDATVNPVMSQSVCAFSVKAKATSEIVAVDRNGKWHVHKLPEPTDQLCSPTVSTYLALFHVGRHVHAFSSTQGKWDTIQGTGATVGFDMAVLETASKVAVFSAAFPKWAVLDTGVIGDTEK